MNERIFKLALKAMDFQGAVDIDTELKLTNSELAKFAELIVRECADSVQFYYKDHMCEVIAHDMKQHFGVEE
jgi:hypothetical protein